MKRLKRGGRNRESVRGLDKRSRVKEVGVIEDEEKGIKGASIRAGEDGEKWVRVGVRRRRRRGENWIGIGMTLEVFSHL